MNAKSYISLLLACLIGLHAWQMSLIVLNYEYNQEAFVRLFCENKDKPITVCGGKCFVQKSIKKASHNNSTSQQEIKLSWSPLWINTSENHLLNRFFACTSFFYSYHDEIQELLLYQKIFQPPRFVAATV